jgi:hypothetical protein
MIRVEGPAATGDPLESLIRSAIEILQRFGPLGWVAVALLLLWWQWAKVKDLPGVATVVRRLGHLVALLRRRRLPKARGDRFSVGIVHFVDDDDHRAEQLVRSGLSDFLGIEVLTLDREISDDGEDGHARARQLLHEVRADAMIWGRVLHYGSTTVPKLFWTLPPKLALDKASEHYRPTDQLKLPEIFGKISGPFFSCWFSPLHPRSLR